MSDCLFCQIAGKKEHAYIIWEDEEHMAFLDRYPKSPGHTLVIPKKHSATFLELNEPAFVQLMKASRVIAHRMKEVCDCERIIMRLVGLHVPHTHVHIETSGFPIDDAHDFEHIQEIMGRR